MGAFLGKPPVNTLACFPEKIRLRTVFGSSVWLIICQCVICETSADEIVFKMSLLKNL